MNTTETRTIKRIVKQTHTHTTEKEVEITLPYFSKSKTGTYFYKVFGDDSLDAIQVRIDSHLYSIGVTAASNAFNEDEECTEIEFEVAYESALNHLQNLKKK